MTRYQGARDGKLCSCTASVSVVGSLKSHLSGRMREMLLNQFLKYQASSRHYFKAEKSQFNQTSAIFPFLCSTIYDRRGRLSWEQCFQNSKNNIKLLCHILGSYSPSPKNALAMFAEGVAVVVVELPPKGADPVTGCCFPGGSDCLPTSRMALEAAEEKLPHLSDFNLRNLPGAHVESR